MVQGSLTDALQDTLQVFDEVGFPLTTPEVATQLELGRRTAYGRLERLVEEGELETKKVGANARVWWRPPPAEGSDIRSDTADQPQWEQQFQALVDATEEYAIFMLDLDGFVQTWNPGAERIKEYEADEILDTHFSRFYTDEDQSNGVPATHLKAAAEHGSVEDEGWRVREDGSYFWANDTISAIRNDIGELTGYAKVTRDMTDRREYEQQLREEKAFIESLFDTQEDLLYAFDGNGQFLRWNEQVPTVTGYTDEEIESIHPLDLIADRATEKTGNAIEEILNEGDHLTLEVPLKTADGREIPYEFTGGPITDDEGVIIGITGVGRDISDRKAKERSLERQRDELQSELNDIFTRIDEAFFALDEDWRITYANDQAAVLTERPVRELLQSRVWDALPEVADGTARKLAEYAVETQESVELEFKSAFLDRWFEIRGYPDETGMSVFVRDITEQKQRKSELQQYETTVETVWDAVTTLDSDGNFVMVNEAFCEMTGYEREQIIGEPATLILDEADLATADALQQEVEAGHRNKAVLEYDLITSSGKTVPVEARYGPCEFADGSTGGTGMIRDISERKERERELELYETIVETIEDGVYVLDEDFHFVHVNDAYVEMTGYSRKELIGSHCSIVVSEAVSAESFEQTQMMADDGRGYATIEADIHCADGSRLPAESRFTAIETGDRGLLKIGVVRDTSNRVAREQELIDQRERLAALSDLNVVAREITGAVIEQSTREEIEETVCESLAATDAYEFAWVAEVDAAEGLLEPRASAGTGGYAEEITVSIDSDHPEGGGPGQAAIREGEIQVVQDVFAGSSFEPWRNAATKYGFTAIASIPIVHDRTVYGVLALYADRQKAFDAAEREVVSQLGEIVGYAIAAAQRKQALMSDELVELDFRIEDVFATVDRAAEQRGTITLDHTVPVGDGEYLVYGTATTDALDALTAIVESDPAMEEVTVQSYGDPVSFELRTSDSTVLSVVASHGGYIDQAVLEDGDLTLSIHLAPTTEVRHVIDTVEAIHPATEMIRRRQIRREPDDSEHVQRRLFSDLTDRQHTTLDVAYHAGYFEWPRDKTAEEIAATMGVTAPTFHNHLRKAQQKVLETVFSASPPGRVR